MSKQNLQSQRTDLLSTKNIDFSGRQIKNAGNGTDTQDYITLGQLNTAIKPLATTEQLQNSIVGLGLPTEAIIGSVLFAGRKTPGSSLSFFADSSLVYTISSKSLAVGSLLASTNITLSSLTASEPVLSNSTKQLISGQIDLSSASYVKNQLTVPFGGTGLANLTAGSVLVGNGTSAISLLAGITGAITLSSSSASVGSSSATFISTLGTTTIQYKDWTNTNQTVTVYTSSGTASALVSVSGTFLTSASITNNAFTDGVRTT